MTVFGEGEKMIIILNIIQQCNNMLSEFLNSASNF